MTAIPKKLYNLDQLQELLGVQRQTLYNYLRQGKLHGKKIGARWYIEEEQLEKFLEGDKQT